MRDERERARGVGVVKSVNERNDFFVFFVFFFFFFLMSVHV